MAIPAKMPGRCPQCQEPIAPGQMIAKALGKWVHASPCAEGKSQAPLRVERHGTLENRLDGLVRDIEVSFPGSLGVWAEIEVKYFRSSYERIIASPWVFFPESINDVWEEDFRRQRRNLYEDACELLEHLAIEAFNGDTFPDAVAWPEELLYLSRQRR